MSEKMHTQMKIHLVEFVPIFAPYLDTECGALLRITCKQIYNNFADYLRERPSEAVQHAIGRIYTDLMSSGNHKIIGVYENESFFILLGLHYAAKAGGVDLELSSSSVFSTIRMADAIQRVGWYFEKAYSIVLENAPHVKRLASLIGYVRGRQEIRGPNDRQISLIDIKSDAQTRGLQYPKAARRIEYHMRQFDFQKSSGAYPSVYTYDTTIELLNSIEKATRGTVFIQSMGHEGSLFCEVKYWCYQAQISTGRCIEFDHYSWNCREMASVGTLVFLFGNSTHAAVDEFKRVIGGECGVGKLNVYFIAHSLGHVERFFMAPQYATRLHMYEWDFILSYKLQNTVADWLDPWLKSGGHEWMNVSYVPPQQLPYRICDDGAVSERRLDLNNPRVLTQKGKPFKVRIVLTHARMSLKFTKCSTKEFSDVRHKLTCNEHLIIDTSSFHVTSQVLYHHTAHLFWVFTGCFLHNYPENCIVRPGFYQVADPRQVQLLAQEPVSWIDATNKISNRDRSPTRSPSHRL